MTATPTISVVIPAYNAERFLAATIRSVSSQSYPKLEIVVVDDGSTDGTRKLLEGLRYGESRLRWIQRPNGGQSAARNTGVAEATGEFVAFLDADDLWAAEKTALQLEALTQADVVFSSAEHFSDDSGVELPSHLFQRYSGLYEGLAFFNLLYVINDIPMSSVILRRERLKRVGGFDPDPAIAGCEDWDLWMRLALDGAVFFGLPQKLVRYRSHSTQTSANRAGMASSALALAEKYASSFPKSNQAKAQIVGLHRELVRLAIARKDFATACRFIRRLSRPEVAGLFGLLRSIRPCMSLAKALFRSLLAREFRVGRMP